MEFNYLLKEMVYYVRLNRFKRVIKKFLLTQTLLSNLVNTKWYNKIYSNRIKKGAQNLTPKILQIETTNACNAKCVMCPHSIMKRKIKIMNLENFKKVLDNVMKSYKIERFTLNGFGEPLLDKGIIDKIKYVNERYPKLKIDIYTNGGLLTKEKSDALLKTKLGRVTFSINGTEENYKEVMGLDYETTKKNVLYFLKKRKELKNPVLTNISMMILKETEEKTQKFIKFWKYYANSVRAYYPSDWAGELKSNLGEQKIPYGRKQWPCAQLWTHIVIHSDGEFIICCRDFESKTQFGNIIKGADIKKMRESKEYKNLQEKHLNFDFSSSICETCDHSYDSSLDWW